MISTDAKSSLSTPLTSFYKLYFQWGGYFAVFMVFFLSFGNKFLNLKRGV